MTGPQVAPTLRVQLLQRAASLDPAVNRASLTGIAATGREQEPVDLIVLPEASARDFGPVTEPLAPYAEPQGGPFDTVLTALADSTGTTVVAGMFESASDADRPFNTLLVRGGATASYRKIHLYDSFGYRESDRLSAGAWEPVVVDVRGWRVGVLTCYDLRFPELARDLVAQGADVLVVPAAWLPGRTPEEQGRKLDHWRTLARARAIENVSYVVAVGQPAPRYTGHSLVVDPYGEVVAEAGPGPADLTAALDRAVLDEARRTNPSLANRVR